MDLTVALVGFGNEGKTTFLKQILDHKHQYNTIPNDDFMLSAEINTSAGPIVVMFIEFDKLPSDRHFDWTLIMFDLTDINSFDHANNLLQTIENSDHIVLVGNKQDKDDEVIIDNVKAVKADHDIPYYAISAKTGHNCSELLLYILQTQSKNQSLKLKYQE